nr:immunoglobulin light chain junction region [Macaca mulatta]MOV97811.1 immunoglobulin light chain junction region [Macaca mulatta]MOV99314.1 immunoglobulin light chain junction region [Macaca mulatta]MOW01381.1 immunoglobulin light chain junction region [Macaca mulatta]
DYYCGIGHISGLVLF